MVNNLFCTITNLSLRTDTSSKVPVTAPTIERLTKPNIELPQLLEDVKSLYVARDNSLVHKVTSSSAIEGRTPYLVYCFTKPGIKSKVKGIRCCVCSEPYTAKLSKQHNNTNMLAFGARVIGVETAKMIVDEWMKAEFEGGRHQNRIDMITKIEEYQEL